MSHYDLTARAAEDLREIEESDRVDLAEIHRVLGGNKSLRPIA